MNQRENVPVLFLVSNFHYFHSHMLQKKTATVERLPILKVCTVKTTQGIIKIWCSEGPVKVCNHLNSDDTNSLQF